MSRVLPLRGSYEAGWMGEGVEVPAQCTRCGDPFEPDDMVMVYASDCEMAVHSGVCDEEQAQADRAHRVVEERFEALMVM